jgi:hypothetical protein
MEFIQKIKQYKDVLDTETFDILDRYLRQPKWALSVSDPKYSPHKVFWGMRLDDEPFFNKKVFSIVEELTGKKFITTSILANAQSTLQDGAPHVDSESTDTYTFILYANKTWDYQWGGQTIFFDRYRYEDSEEVMNSDSVYSVYPIPNTAVFFPSNMVHFGSSPSRDFYEMRYTIAYHLKEI